jgi:hypothetical protein
MHRPKITFLVLSQKIDWNSLESDFSKFYALKGAPSKQVKAYGWFVDVETNVQ